MSGLARFTTPTRQTGPPADPPAPPDAPLRRFLGPRPRPTPGEVCELCSAPMGDDHRHVVDLDQRGILCTCRPCGLLFEGGPDVHDHFRTVPDRYLRLDPFHLAAEQWAALQIPVGVAFVVANSRLEQHVAFYPSPGGATESELTLEAWAAIVADNPPLDGVAPDVEAVLIRTSAGGRPGAVMAHDGHPDAHVVPVDRCYELVGTLRLLWRGFDGGHDVRRAVREFFDDVTARARPVAPEAGPVPGGPP